MTALILPWNRPMSVAPQRRKEMPTRGERIALGPGVWLAPFNRQGLPPHYHIDAYVMEDGKWVPTAEKRLIRPSEGMQAMSTAVPRALITCEQLGCSWFLFGHEGMDEGEPFKHPAGVECGDFDRCPDPNCPCPRYVYRWQSDSGMAHAHVAPCRFCDGTFRFATSTGHKVVTFDEFFYRTDEGLDSLVTIRKRGL